MKKPLLFLVTFFLGLLTLDAQALLSGSYTFSHKKTAYITKHDGTEIQGKIDKVKRNKGLLESVAIKQEGGSKLKLIPSDIKFMYLPPSGLDKISKGFDELFTMDKWDREDIQSDLIKDGYMYFEGANVDLKKGENVLLLQLLNPGYSSKLKVFFDPKARETTGVGIGGLTVAGGLEKAYYIQKGDDPAYKMKKKDYKKDFTNFYKDCPSIYEEYGDKPNWPDFAKHVYYYSKNCQQ